MDEQIEKTLKMYYGNPDGVATDEFYADYVSVCHADHVEPRGKNVIIREACDVAGACVVARTTKYFYFRRDDR